MTGMTDDKSHREESAIKAKYNVGALQRTSSFRAIGAVLAFMFCLSYVTVSWKAGNPFAPWNVSPWCAGPFFACATPMLFFWLAGKFMPSARVKFLDRAFYENSNLATATDTILQMLQKEDLSVEDDSNLIQKELHGLASEIQQAEYAGANRHEIMEFVDALLKDDLRVQSPGNPEFKGMVAVFLEEFRP